MKSWYGLVSCAALDTGFGVQFSDANYPVGTASPKTAKQTLSTVTVM